MRRTTTIALFVMFVMLMPQPARVFAQAGSTGGTIGKQDKSISGGSPMEGSRDTPRKSQASAVKLPSKTMSSACDKIVGTWKWGPGFLVVIKSNGTAQPAGGGSGTWTCNKGQYIFVWSIGIIDYVSLSTDGNSMAGHNRVGGDFSGTRF